ncbi:MAG: restriction endonuclease subunit S [Pseudohongiella sp.]|nr:restriction endonuclease subunit S [Pseudohongiella sp.]
MHDNSVSSLEITKGPVSGVSGWVQGRVGDLLVGLESGVSVNGEDRELAPNEVGVLKISSVTYGIFNPNAVKAVIPGEVGRVRTQPKAGQIIISRSNTEELVGASAFIFEDHPNLYLPDKLWQTIPADNADMRWLSYCLSSSKTRYTLSRLATGTSGSMKNITQDELLSLKIEIPPLPEQKKIAEILSTWDDAIAANEDLLANSRQRKKALMQQLLTGKKRLPGFGGQWQEMRLKECGAIYSGGTPDTATAQYWDGDINWLTPTDVTALKGRFTHKTVRQISESGLMNSSAKLLPPGSVMVCTRATVGEVAMAAEPICTNQGFKSIVPNSDTSSEFLFYLLSSSKGKMLRLSSGSTFLELSKKDFDNMEFGFPEVKEQKAIASVLSTADEEIEALEQRINNLKLQKKALMQQLLTGKKRVAVESAAA